MRRSLVLALLALGAARPALAQNFDSIQIRTQQVSGGVYMLQGSGGNIGLSVGDDGAFLVDDQYAPLTPKVLAAIRVLTQGPVRFVVNTHWHFDHTGGNENMAGAGAALVAHENVRRRLASGGLIEALNRTEPPAPPTALPDVTFSEGLTFHLNGDSVVVVHVSPAHTDGDSFVHFTRANVVHTGDFFLSAALPFVDLSSGGSIHGFIEAASRVLAVSNARTRIIPGHGPLADRARVQAYRDMLVTLVERMRHEIAAGRTLEQIVAMNVTAPYASEWPGGHERFVRVLHQELSRN